MGWLCDQVVKAGCFALADFVCPTPAAREAFFEGSKGFMIWVDRIHASRFEDTNRMFVQPDQYNLRVTKNGSPEYWAEQAMGLLRPVFDWQRPTAIFIGRYQPFHDGHRALIAEGLKRVGQVCVAVRDTHRTDEKNPYAFEHVRARIEHALREYEGRFIVVPLPNITNVFYGRDVAYAVERIDLDDSIREHIGDRFAQTYFSEKVAKCGACQRSQCENDNLVFPPFWPPCAGCIGR